RHPGIVVIGVEISLAAIAHEGDDGAGFAGIAHALGDLQRTPQIRAGGAAGLAPDAFFQPADGGNRCRIRNLHHGIDDAGHEGRLHLRPADTLDAAPPVDHQAVVVVLVTVVEHGVFRIDHHHLRGMAAVVDVTPDGRRGAAGAGAHDHGMGHRIAFPGHLSEYAFGDVVVAAPVGGAFGVGELVHV